MNEFWASVVVKCIQGFAFVYDALTYPIYYAIDQPWHKLEEAKRQKAVSITGKPEGPYKGLHKVVKDGQLITDGLNSMYDAFIFCLKKHKTRAVLGTREVLCEEDEKQPNGRVFKKLVLGKYDWINYEEMNEKINNFARALYHMGFKSGENVVIFAETRAEWLITAIACFKCNIPVVTLYTTLGEDALIHGINESSPSLVLTSYENLSKLKSIISKTPSVKHIIYMEGLKKPVLSEYPEHVKIQSFNSVESLGASQEEVDFKLPTKDDIAIIMYTSGSTGVPKGVVITHKNLLTSLGGFSGLAETKSTDVYMAFLPLAHVLELFGEFNCMLYGVPIGYSSPLTMFDRASKVKRGTKGDASVLQPTCLAMVPLILDRIYKTVNEIASEGGAFNRAMFKMAYDYRLSHIKNGFRTPLTDRLVFKKIRALLGGKVRVMVSGGAPLSTDTHEFVRVCLGCPLLQGYGLTETCACSTLMTLDDMSVGGVGVPLPGVQILLKNWDEGGYHVTDKPFPRGELVIGGDNVSKGYYKMESGAQSDYIEQNGMRWFSSGDIAEVRRDGSFKIIDRKKDLVKLQMGEYISLGKVETAMNTIGLVDNVCVYGDSFQMYTVAILVPNQKQLLKLGAKLNKSGKSFQELCADNEVVKLVEKIIGNDLKEAGLDKFEIPAKIKLTDEVWTPDNGLVTAALKIRRNHIQRHYQSDIDAMYNK